MKNRYPGTCYRCGKIVPAGEGHFERIPYKNRRPGDAKWRTQHVECAIQYRGTDKVHAPCADPELAKARQDVENAIGVCQNGGQAQVSVTHLYWYFAEKTGIHRGDSHVSKFDFEQCVAFCKMLDDLKPSKIRTWRRKRSRQGWKNAA